MLSLINDILDYSKIEAYKLDLEIVDFHLSETIGETIELMKVRAREKGLDLIYISDANVPQFVRG